MARLKKINKKLRASTLIEVLVAMVIIIVVYSIFLVMILNIKKSFNTTPRIAALLETENILFETKQKFLFINEDYKTENFLIKKTINQYMKCKELRELKFEVFDLNGKLILERQELIKLNN